MSSIIRSPKGREKTAAQVLLQELQSALPEPGHLLPGVFSLHLLPGLCYLHLPGVCYLHLPGVCSLHLLPGGCSLYQRICQVGALYATTCQVGALYTNISARWVRYMPPPGRWVLFIPSRLRVSKLGFYVQTNHVLLSENATIYYALSLQRCCRHSVL